MRILVVKPGRRPVVQEIDGTVEAMREIVGGELQAIYPSDDVALVFNEGAKALQSPPNRGVLYEDGTFCDIVYGTFILCGAPEDSNYFVSLTAAQVQRYLTAFASTGFTVTVPYWSDISMRGKEIENENWRSCLYAPLLHRADQCNLCK